MSKPSSVKLPAFLPPQIVLALLAVLAYSAFLMTGFDGPGNTLGASRPLPIFIFLGLLLLGFQVLISTERATRHLIYLFLTSGFALFYAASVIFYSNSFLGRFTRNEALYVIIQIVLFVVFLYDAVERRREKQDKHPLAFDHFAVDFTGLAAPLFTSWGLLSILSNCNYSTTSLAALQVVPSWSCGSGTPYVHFSTLPLGFPSPLPTLDAALGFGALGISLLLYVIIGLNVSVLGQRASGTPDSSPASPQPPLPASAGTGSGPWHALGQLMRIAYESATEVLRSLRLTLSPLVWMIPAFSIANFSQQFSNYLTKSGASACPQAIPCIWPLFDPLNGGDYGSAFVELLLGAFAVVGVILAVAVVEHDAVIIEDALRIMGQAGTGLAVTLVFFLLSLSSINAFVLFFNRAVPTIPFQLGPSILLALMASAGIALYDRFHPRKAELTATREEVFVPDKTRRD